MDQNKAYKLAGVAAIAAGAIFATIQFIHPADVTASLTTSQWELAHVLSFIFPFLGLFGLSGIYFKQLKPSGCLGLVGYILLSAAFCLMICFAFYEAFIAPVLATQAPQYAAEVMSILDGAKGPRYIGTVYQLNGITYLLGGIIFGLATLKAKVFPRWAGALMVGAVLITLSAAALPFLARPSAVVFSLSFATLGYLLATGEYAVTSKKK